MQDLEHLRKRLGDLQMLRLQHPRVRDTACLRELDVEVKLEILEALRFIGSELQKQRVKE